MPPTSHIAGDAPAGTSGTLRDTLALFVLASPKGSTAHALLPRAPRAPRRGPPADRLWGPPRPADPRRRRRHPAAHDSGAAPAARAVGQPADFCHRDRTEGRAPGVAECDAAP